MKYGPTYIPWLAGKRWSAVTQQFYTWRPGKGFV